MKKNLISIKYQNYFLMKIKFKVKKIISKNFLILIYF